MQPFKDGNIILVKSDVLINDPGGEDDHLRVVQMCGPTGVFFQEFSLATGIIWKRKSLAAGVNLKEKSLDTGAILLNVPICGSWILDFPKISA